MIKVAIHGKGLIPVILFLGCVVLACFPTGLFVDQDIAVRALESHGFTEVVVVDRATCFIALRGGEKSDSVRFTCRAINPAGQPVTMYVFSGWLFKGATIRTLG